MMARELAWIRDAKQGKAGQSRGNKGRENRLTEMLEEEAQQSAAQRVEGGAIVIPPPPRLGGNLLECRGVGHTFDLGLPTEQRLFSGLSFKMTRGQRIGVIGPNGVGKTTLMRILAGDLEPQEGAVALGDTVRLGFVNQSRADLDPERTVYEEISQGEERVDLGGGVSTSMRAYVSSFNLRGEAHQKRVSSLSGGERNRVHLAKELQKRNNVLFLDEPTNDLDVDTLRSLEEALADFEGCLVMISHDRWFLNRLCTDVIAFDGMGGVEFHQGDYESYERERERRGDAAEDGRQTRFRPLRL
jgi:ATPase subunit of ABC transporter with duplicated ATPase domains